MIYAYVNHGRWIAECPKCRWAVQGSPAELAAKPLVCGVLPDGRPSRGCGHQDRVQFPPEAEAIMRVLEVREETRRNWTPAETLADLRIENAAHGLISGLEVA